MSAFKEYEHYDAVGLAELVQKGEVTPVELAEAAIQRIERLNAKLNVVVAKAYDDPRAAGRRVADGPFKGVPFLVKDAVVTVKGVPFHNGSRFWKGYVPERDSELVARYKRAGLNVLGTTNTPELAMMAVTEPKAFGPTRNPWSPEHASGGSSGGSAAAVAAGIVPFAHGTDGAGSLRIPASCCGVFGMKPSRGRVPLGPDWGEHWSGLTVMHAMSRSVRDSAALLDATAGPDAGCPYAPGAPAKPFADCAKTPPARLRIAFSAKAANGAPVDPQCARAVQDAAALLSELGHEVAEDAPSYDAVPTLEALGLTVTAGVRAEIERGAKLLGRRPALGDLETAAWIFWLLGGEYSAADLAAAQMTMNAATRAVGEFLTRYDVFVTPTLPVPPPKIGALQPQGGEKAMQDFIARAKLGRVLKWTNALAQLAEQVFAFIPFTPLANITGGPAMSLPLAMSDGGLPIGVMFQGRYGDEGLLYSLAGQLEEARPWAGRRPQLA